jgi:phage FluMu protein Com
MPAMKTLRCPHCGGGVKVQAEARATVGQTVTAQEYLTDLRMLCPGCQEWFGFSGDPRSRDTWPAAQ